MTKTLGTRLRELREENDLSLRELAKKAGGLSAAFLSDVELGRRFPSEDVLGRLAEALRSSVEDLKEFDTRPPIEEIKRMAQSNPALGVAFRKIVEMPEDELLAFADKGKKQEDEK